MDRPAFITGSHAYGTPHAESDVDLVILVDNYTEHFLADQFVGGDPEYPSAVFKIGRLNVIAVGPAKFDQWKRGTDELKKIAPISRDRAVAHFKALFAEARQEPEQQEQPRELALRKDDIDNPFL